MGGNGSFASGATATEEGRRWKTVYIIGRNIKVIELKNRNDSIKLPEESHSVNSIYVIFNKGSKGIKAIAEYDSNGKKVYEIHTTDHKGLGMHYHLWSNGRPLNPIPLTTEMRELLDKISNLEY